MFCNSYKVANQAHLVTMLKTYSKSVPLLKTFPCCHINYFHSTSFNFKGVSVYAMGNVIKEICSQVNLKSHTAIWTPSSEKAGTA